MHKTATYHCLFYQNTFHSFDTNVDLKPLGLSILLGLHKTKKKHVCSVPQTSFALIQPTRYKYKMRRNSHISKKINDTVNLILFSLVGG